MDYEQFGYSKEGLERLAREENIDSLPEKFCYIDYLKEKYEQMASDIKKLNTRISELERKVEEKK